MNQKSRIAASRQKAEQTYKTARLNLLLMLIFTLVNLGLLFAGSDVMMLFSATIPYFAVMMGTISQIPSFLAGAVAVSVVLLAVYLLCYFMSKKHFGWMIAALVLFSIDTLFLIGVYFLAQDVSGILDAVFHAWVLYYLIVGVCTGVQLKKMPEEPALEEPVEGTEETGINTAPLRAAAPVKARVFLEADVMGHHVCYRRVKRINELVIDGYVYDDLEILVETAHALSADVDGHVFEAGYDGMAHSYLRVDGEPVAKKLRLY